MKPHYTIFVSLVLFVQFSIPTSAKAEEDPSWSQNYITELKCDEVKPIKNKGATDPEIRKLLKKYNRWYIPIISKYGLTSFSLLARDKPIKSDGEASQICLNYKRLPSSTDTIIKEKVRQFEKKNIRVTCDNTDLSYITCVKDETNEKQYRYERVRWSDGKIILYTICWPTGYAGWHVLYKKKSLSPNQKRKIFKRVREMGFDPKKSFEIPFDEC